MSRKEAQKMLNHLTDMVFIAGGIQALKLMKEAFVEAGVPVITFEQVLSVFDTGIEDLQKQFEQKRDVTDAKD